MQAVGNALAERERCEGHAMEGMEFRGARRGMATPDAQAGHATIHRNIDLAQAPAPVAMLGK